MVQRNPRRTVAEGAEIIEQYRRSGLSVQAFCEKNKLVPVTFQKWKRRLSSPPLAQPAGKPAFTPALKVHSGSASSAGSSVNVQIGPRSHSRFHLKVQSMNTDR